MADRQKGTEEGTLGRLSKRGEEALSRLVEELGRSDLVGDAVGRALAAKGKLDGASRRALDQVGLAPAEEVRDLRRQVERLEKRLAKLEQGKKPAAARTRKTSTRAKKTTEKAASPAAGRAVGGGTARGSSAGGATS